MSENKATVYDAIDQTCPDYFSTMLCDQDRNMAYRNAIFKAIVCFCHEQGRFPRVLDVGAGTGLLSIFAAQGGAASVVGLEANPKRAKIAKKNIKENAVTKRCTILTILSTQYTLKETEQPFDIVICELMGTMVHYERMNFFIHDLFERGIVSTFDKQKRYIIPEQVKMWTRPFQRKINLLALSYYAGLDNVDKFIVSIASEGQFQHHTSLSLIPHADFFEPIGDDSNIVLLVNQKTDQLIVKNTFDIKRVEAERDSIIFYFVEWKCVLFGETFIENSISAVSKLSASVFAARLSSWGFSVLALPPTSTKFAFSVTEDDVKIVKKRKITF